MTGRGASGGKRRRATEESSPGAVAAGRDPATLARVLGHAFSDSALLAEALTHSSAAADRGHRFGNERLEFLGDRVLGLVIAEMLMAEFPDDAEGALARRLTGLVRRETLEHVAESLDLGRYVILAESEERAGGRRNRSIQADACEALIGALYLDGGMEVARRFILERWRPLIDAHGRGRRDAKTRLQEWAQGRGLALPHYRVIAREGPAHAPRFTVEASVGGYPPAVGAAPAKRAAEQNAAAALLDLIDAAGEGGDV